MKNFIKNIKNKFRFVKKNPWILLLWNNLRMRKGKREVEIISDFDAVMNYYETYTGHKPNLENPESFSEKLQWLKLFYRDPLMAKCADKFSVRDYVKKCGYEMFLNDLYGVFEDVDDMDINKLPQKFVLKGAHGSAWNIICRDKAKINWTVWKLIMKSWLKQNLYWYGREWVYKDIKPRIICEKYLEDESGELRDYKFFCFNGVPKCIQVETGRYSSFNTRNFYDTEWRLLPFGKELPHNPEATIPKPENFELMIEKARNLSKPFCFVRVDFYNVLGQIYFGELTFFPAGGAPNFVPQEYDQIVGSWLQLPEKNI